MNKNTIYWIGGIATALTAFYIFSPPLIAWNGDKRSRFQRWMQKNDATSSSTDIKSPRAAAIK